MMLEDLPTFEVKRVSHPEEENATIHGVFSQPERISKGVGWLLSDTESHLVTLTWLNRNRRLGTLRFDEVTPHHEVKVGGTYAWIEGYGAGIRARKIVDVTHQWIRTVFEPEDAIAFRENGVCVWRRAADGLPPGAEPVEVIPRGWQHEHCEICWATIGDQDVGCRDAEGDWLCLDCYHRYAERHDLSFLAED